MAIAAALVAACTFAEPEEMVDETIVPEIENPQEFKVVTVSAENPQTKTSYAGEKTFAWSEGDQISIYCTDAVKPANTGFYTFTTATGGSSSATFTGSIPVNAVIGDVALYPAASHTYSDSKYHFQVEGEKNYIATHESADVPMYGVNGGNDNFTFNQMTGAVKFTVNNIPDGVDKVKFTFKAASSKLSGSFDVTTSAPYTWATAKGADESERSIVRYCPVSANAFSVYVPYTEGTIWGDNTLLIQDYTGDVVGSTLYNQTNIGAIPVTRNKVTKLATLACDYRSYFGVNWSVIEEATNASGSIRKMKATMDEDFFYILLDVNNSALTKIHSHDHYIRVMIGGGASSGNWGSDTYSQLTANVGGSSKDTQAWAVVGGVPSFSLSSNREFQSHVSSVQNTVYYEIKIPRTSATAVYSALSGSDPIKVGVVMDDYWHNSSPEEWHAATENIGIIPASGNPMYIVPALPTPTAVIGSADIDKTYHETLTETVNPERGLYRHNEYKFTSDRLASKSVSCEDDKSLVLTLFYLPYYLTSDLSLDAISDINTVFSNVRAAGKKAIVRFAYTWDNANHDPAVAHEAGLDQMKNHISSLATVLSSNADVIYVVQAGFIGTWGEWYYNGNDFTYTRHDDSHTVDDYDNRAQIIDALLAAVPSTRQIQLRTPHYKFYYYYAKNGTPTNVFTPIAAWDGTDSNSRLGFHNDAFLADATDMGTFHYDEERSMWQSQSAWTVAGGETGFVEPEDVNPIYCDLDHATETIAQYHYSYLNDAQSNNEIVKYWVANDIYPIIRKKLGYRLVLNSAKVTGTGWSSGTTLNFKLKISNTGSASVIYTRPCKLVLIHNGTATELKDMILLHDIRNIAPDSNYTYDFNVSLPQDVMTGDKLAIWMPDNAAGLQYNAAYSIRLSNSDVKWENGYNVFYTF